MGRKVNFLNYFKVDLFRAFSSWRFLVGVFGVVLAMYIASLEGIASDTNVIYVVWIVVYGMLFMISLIFAAFPVSGFFCEDFEQKYINMLISRGNLKSYAISKILIITITAAITMMLGMVIYVSLLHMKIPWFDAEDSICQSALSLGGFRSILAQKRYIVYFALFGFQYGILASVLALLAAYVSLYINNRLLTLSIPFMSFYLITYYSRALFGDAEKINLIYVFNATYNIWDNDMYSFLYALLFGAVLTVVLGKLIMHRLKRKLYYE